MGQALPAPLQPFMPPINAHPIKLIVGLGNPGGDYAETRHNAGFWFVEQLARRYNGNFRAESRHHGQLCRISVSGRDCRLLMPSTFMNRSGQSVSSLASYFKIAPEEILVAHDELDLPTGQARLKRGGGHAGHNGLRDIMSAIGSRDFLRLRIGIDRPQQKGPVTNYVLGRPSKQQRSEIEDAIDKAADCLELLIQGELPQAMNRLHSSR